MLGWVLDPETSEQRAVHAYRRSGRLVISLVPNQNTSVPGSAAVLEARVAFGSAAIASRGRKKEAGGQLPVAAEAVRDSTRGRTYRIEEIRSPLRIRSEIRCRDLLSAETIDQLEQTLRVTRTIRRSRLSREPGL
jgi:hypothetical protein